MSHFIYSNPVVSGCSKGALHFKWGLNFVLWARSQQFFCFCFCFFSVKGQIVNISASLAIRFLLQLFKLCCCVKEAVIDSMSTNVRVCIPVKLKFMKQPMEQIWPRE